MSLLKNLRSKKPHEKNRIAVAGAVGLTAIVGLLWLSSLPARFDGGNATTANNNGGGSESTGRLEEAKEQFGSSLQQMGSLFNTQDEEGDAILAEEEDEGDGIEEDINTVNLQDFIDKRKDELDETINDGEVDSETETKKDDAPQVILIGTSSTALPKATSTGSEQISE